MAHHGTANYDTHDRWKANLGKFPEGAFIHWRIEVAGDNQTIPLDGFSATSATPPPRSAGSATCAPSPNPAR
jgi:hypothetical protein